jgi:hypothetical protein
VSDITDEEYALEQTIAKSRELNERWRYHYNEEVRPRLATFQVSALHGADEQEEMARALCDFMNKVAVAQEQAIKQNSLVEVLTSKAAEYNPNEKDNNAV